ILHYHANRRKDGDLWRRVREMEIPETLRRKLDLFRNRGRFFRYEDELFAESSWIAVMLGQGVYPAGWDPLADAIDPAQIRNTLDRIRTMFAQTASTMPRHEDWLARHAPAGSLA
ncbi:MAG: tryptophan halogenase, partial [Sphingomonadales bacterium]